MDLSIFFDDNLETHTIMQSTTGSICVTCGAMGLELRRNVCESFQWNNPGILFRRRHIIQCQEYE